MNLKRICYFGTFDPEYERNRVLVSGLRANGVEVDICRVSGKGPGAAWRLWCESRKIKNGYDAVFVGYSDSRLPVLLAKLIFRCPVVWDAFYSLYDSIIFDRRLAGPHSPKAAFYWLQDWLGCLLADRILLDTEAHISYFVRTFNINRAKFIRVFIGADNEVFHPGHG